MNEGGEFGMQLDHGVFAGIVCLVTAMLSLLQSFFDFSWTLVFILSKDIQLQPEAMLAEVGGQCGS